MAELTGSALQFSDGSHLGGAPFSYVRYTTSNISCTSSSWVDSWNTGNFLIPAGAFFRVLVYTPTRQDGGQWGGHYFRFYWQTNDDGTWRELGHSGYGGGDNSMTHRPPSQVKVESHIMKMISCLILPISLLTLILDSCSNICRIRQPRMQIIVMLMPQVIQLTLDQTRISDKRFASGDVVIEEVNLLI